MTKRSSSISLWEKGEGTLVSLGISSQIYSRDYLHDTIVSPGYWRLGENFHQLSEERQLTFWKRICTYLEVTPSQRLPQ